MKNLHSLQPLLLLFVQLKVTEEQQPVQCRLDGIYVSFSGVDREGVSYSESVGWQVDSGPDENHIYLIVFMNPSSASSAFSCDLLDFDVEITDMRGVCENTSAKYTPVKDKSGMFRICERRTIFFIVESVAVLVEPLLVQEGSHFLCLKHRETGSTVLAGRTAELTITIRFQRSARFSLQTWQLVLIVIVLQAGAGMCSGLNLGLLALDLSDLRIIMEAGNARERRYAKVVYHLRSKGNALLVAIILCNSAFNSVNTVLLESKLRGIGASIASTILITVFGEIVPQAVFSRFSLTVGARTSWITRVLLLITFPFSYPVGKLLDYVLGKEPPAAYSREKVQVVLREHIPGVQQYEHDMISGLLELESKTAGDHMRKLDNVFMVDYDQIYDEHLYMQICDSGYSRIPVFKNERNMIVGVLHIKDLSIFGTFGQKSVGAVCDYFNLPFIKCKRQTLLNTLLQNLRDGIEPKSHMVIVEEDEDEASNSSKAIGILTMEDIIEELLNFEILDEFDKSDEEKMRRFAGRRVVSPNQSSLSVHLRHAALRLMLTLEPFKEHIMTTDAINKLIEQCYTLTQNNQTERLYERNKPANYLILILKGKAVLELGKEKLKFDAKPFSYYGVAALIDSQKTSKTKDGIGTAVPEQGYFIPEFNLYTEDVVGYVKIDNVKYKNFRKNDAHVSSIDVPHSIVAEMPSSENIVELHPTKNSNKKNNQK